MWTGTYRKMMRLGRKLFKQEKSKFNDLRFAYLRDTDTGEMLIFCPDKKISRQVKECLEAKFFKYNHPVQDMK